MSADVELIRFEDPEGIRFIEVTAFSTYQETSTHWDPTVEIEAAYIDFDVDHRPVLLNLAPKDALKLAHVIRKQAKLALREEWRRATL